MTFILPKSDDCFKELFRNETVCKYFISDVLGIPLTEIKSVRQANPFLWKSHKHQKQGILDVFLELNNKTKINVEIQLKHPKNWKKRQLFYLSKMYTADLRLGENYSKLNHCISIALLDFNLTDRKEYHSVYKLRDIDGNIFDDIFEVHIIELRKRLTGDSPVDDWIRFFNAESEEDINMIKSKNLGIQKAIEELRHFSLNPHLRLRYEAYLKEKRDRIAIEEYAREQAIAEGLAEGREKKLIELVCRKMRKNKDVKVMAEELEEEETVIQRIYDAAMQTAPDYDKEKVYALLHKKEQ